MICESLKTVLDASLLSRTVHTLELRPTAIDRKLGAGREGRIEREEEDGLGDFLRHPPALHRNHTDHLLPNLGGRVFIGKRFAEDRRVVLTTSIANVKGMPGNATYGAAKAALRSFARTLAAELIPREIRVNAVTPGPIAGL